MRNADIMIRCNISSLIFTLSILFLIHHTKALPSTSSIPTTNNNINDLPNLKAAIIIPGFLTGASEFEPLVKKLKARGIPTLAVPFPNWHWIPCLGGRSMRPILEKIDFTVRHLSSNGGNVTNVPNFEYTIKDLWKDFQTNPGGVLEVGGSAYVDDYPQDVIPQGRFSVPADDAKGKIALIGHSAGGWIGRVYLSNRNYGGRVYNGSSMVHSLITLGSPHGNAPGPAFAGVEWINREPVPSNVRALAVSGKGFKGSNSGQLTQNAYSFCCDRGSDGTSYDGDGVTPIHSALAMEGAEKLILDGKVTHFPWSDVFGGDFFAPDLVKDHKENRTPWYGDDLALDQWIGWLEQATY